MKKITFACLAFVSLTANAAIYRWDNGDLLTNAVAEPGVDLSYANLPYAGLSGAKLNSADLTFAHLDFAHLLKAKLTGADLTGADLTGAFLLKAHLARGILHDTDLTGADLTGANLHNADLTGALYDLETVLPSSVDPVAEGMILTPEPATFVLLGLGGLLLRKPGKN